MTTRSTIAEVTFTRRFRLPEMDRDYPPGTYQIEVDEEPLDVVSTIAYRRTGTRIRLSRAGATELLTINAGNLRAALTEDAEGNLPAAR